MAGRVQWEAQVDSNIAKLLGEAKELRDQLDGIKKEKYEIKLNIDEAKLEKVIANLDKMLESLGKGSGDFKEFEVLSKNLIEIVSQAKNLTKAFDGINSSGINNLISSIQNIDKSLSLLSGSINKEFKDIGKNVDNNTGKINEQRKVTEELVKSNEHVKKSADKSSNSINEETKSLKSFLSTMDKNINGFNTNFEKLSFKPDEEHRYPQYAQQLDNLNSKITEYKILRDSISTKGIISEEDSQKCAKLKEEIDGLSASIKRMPLGEKGFTNLSLDKTAEKINSILKENTKMSKQAKIAIKAYYDEVVSGNPSKPLSEILDKVYKIEQAERAAGRAGKSFLDILKDKTVYGYAAQLANYFLSIADLMRYARLVFDNVKEVDTARTELRKVSDATEVRLSQNFEKSAETAKDLGSSIRDVISATADWSRMGYSVDDAEELARISTLYKNVGDGIDTEAANNSLISTLQGFQLTADDAESIIDKFNEVANNFAIDSAGIGEALQRSAASFYAANTDLSKSIALITATNEVVQDPDSVGTLWKTMSARIRGAKTELDELGEETDKYTETTSELRDLVMSLTGFDIMLDENTFKDVYEIILGIGEKWETLTDVEQASLGEALAGKRNANALYAVLGNLDTLEEAYKTAEESAGSAMQEQENYEKSILYSIDRLMASVEEWSNKLVSSDVLKFFIDLGNILVGISNTITPWGTLALGGGIFALLKNKNVLSGLDIFGANAAKEATMVKAVAAAKTLEAEATNRLTEAEMRNALVSQGYSEKTAKDVSSLYAKAAAKKTETLATIELTSAEAAKKLAEAGMTENAAKFMLVKAGLISQTELETGATVKVTMAKLNEAVANGTLSATHKEVIATALGLTGANGLQAGSFNTLTASIWGSVKALWAFLTTNPVGWALMVAGAIGGTIALYNGLTTSYEEAKEKLEETESELDGVKSEIDSISSKINEINSKDTLSITDKEDLERLKEENKELKIRQKYLEMQKQEEEKEVSDKAKDKYNVEYGRTNREDIDEYKNKLMNSESSTPSASNYLTGESSDSANSSIGYGAQQQTEEEINNLAELIASYEYYSEKKKEAIQSGDRDAIDKYNEKLSNISSSLMEDREELQGFRDDVAKTGDSEELDSINQQIELIDETLLSAGERLVDFINNTIHSSTKNTLVKLVSEGKLTEELLKNNFSQIYDYLVQNGLTFEDFISVLKVYEEEINGIGDAIAEAISPKKLSKKEMISSLNGMSEGFEELDKIYSSIKDDDPFDFKLLDDDNFKETFSGLESYEDFFEQITSNADDIDACQASFNKLVTEWLTGSDVINGLTEENAKLTESMLEQFGVTNAEEVVESALHAEEKALDALIESEEGATAQAEILEAKKRGLAIESENLRDITNEEIIALIEEGNVSQGVTEYLSNLALAKLDINNFKLNTKSDIDQIIALANAAGKSEAYVNALRVALENLQNKTKVAKGTSYYVGGGAKVNLTGEDQAQAFEEAQNAEKEFKAMLTDLKESALNPADFYADIKYGGGSKSNKDSGSGSDKDTEETFDWIQVKIERLEREISNLDKVVSATYKSWSERNQSLEKEISKVTDEIALQENAYKKYMSLANSVGLDKKYQELVKVGALDYSTIKDEKLAEKIKKYQEFYNLAIACEDKLIDLEGDLANLAKQRFDNISSEYDQKLSQIDHETAMIEAQIDNVEARGHIVSVQYYENLKKLEEQNLSTLKAEREALQKALDQAIASGDIEAGSEEWFTMQEAINGVDKAIIESNTSLVELNKSIRDLEWENFDRARDMISQVTDEAEFFIDLMSDKDLFDENGNITEHGEATMGLHLSNMRVHESEAQSYADEIAEINKDLANDPYNVELLERKEELIQSHRDSIKAAKDERQAMIDLAEEGYNKMLESLDELIEKRKEYLQLEKDTYDYQKTIDEQVSEVERLEKIVKALSGDTSEEGMLRLQQSNKELEEAREQLQETQYDKWMSDQEKLLDNMSQTAQEWVDERLSNEEQLLSDIATKTEQNTQTIKETLESEAASVGTFLSDTMTNIWSGDGSVNSVVAELEKIEQYVAAMVEASDKQASEQTSSSNNGSSNTPSSSNSGNSGSSGSGSSSGNNSSSIPPSSKSSSSKDNSSNKNSVWGSWFIKKNYSVPDSKLDKEKSIVDRLKWKDFDASFTARQKYYEAMGLGSASSYTGSASQNTAMIKLMKEHGFNQGGYVGSLVKATGEDGFILANEGEYVFTEEKIKALGQALQNANPFIKAFEHNIKGVTSGLGNAITNNVDMNINMYEVQDVQGLVTELQKDNRFQKVVQQMTIGQISGGNSLSKYKYK